jgi:hypothetical protein
VDDPSRPAFVSEHRFNPASGWGFSVPFAAQGLIFFSHEQSDYVSTYAGRWQVSKEWRVGEYLDVIDYSDPAFPTARPSISVPGQMAGLSPDGKMLYLLGAALLRSGAPAANETEAVHACAYDGVDAYLVNSLALSATWPRPVRIEGARVFLGRASADGAKASQAESWALSAAGRFTLQAVVALKRPASSLACFGGLLAAQDAAGGIELFDASDPSVLLPCGAGEPPGGVWFDLSRAAGAPDEGVWLPLDDFGLASVPVN